MVLGVPASLLSQPRQPPFPPSGFHVRYHSSAMFSILGAFLALVHQLVAQREDCPVFPGNGGSSRHIQEILKSCPVFTFEGQRLIPVFDNSVVRRLNHRGIRSDFVWFFLCLKTGFSARQSLFHQCRAVWGHRLTSYRAEIHPCFSSFHYFPTEGQHGWPF